mgnify:FL=1
MTLTRNEFVVSTEWLDGQLLNPNLRIIDASWYLADLNRFPLEEYKERHIPGASFFDLDEFSDADSNIPHMALDPESFSKKIEVFGINPNCIVVVYDGLGLFSAARLLWLFHLYGFTNVFILDGGLPKWLSENKAVESKIVMHEQCHFLTSYCKELVMDLDQMLACIGSNDVHIVDARSHKRFEGLVPEPREGVRSGKIPSSVNLFYGDLIGEDYTLKPTQALEEIVKSLGINLNKHIVASCGSGVTAAILYIVFKGLGAKRVSVYDGSWCEWGSIDDLALLT